MINRKQVVYKTELYKLYKRKDTWIFFNSDFSSDFI